MPHSSSSASLKQQLEYAALQYEPKEDQRMFSSSPLTLERYSSEQRDVSIDPDTRISGISSPRLQYPCTNWAYTPAWLPGDAPGHRKFIALDEYPLENGGSLPHAYLAYETWGQLNDDASNAVLILHALTADSHVCGSQSQNHPTAGWWNSLVGSKKVIDTDRYFVVAPNCLGGCQGSTGPAWPAPDGLPWGSRFPSITIRDQVKAENQLRLQLGISSWNLVIGPSAGGFRACEWACMFAQQVRSLVLIATAESMSADQIAWAHMQIYAQDLDPSFAGGDYYLSQDKNAGNQGMALARQIAHATYRSTDEFNTRFGRQLQPSEKPSADERYAVESYLEYHGEKLSKRFDPGSYRVLTRAMMSHDIGRGRGGTRRAAQSITARTLIIGVDSDRLFPACECAKLAQYIPCASYREVTSYAGHDGFLIETSHIEKILEEFCAHTASITATAGDR